MKLLRLVQGSLEWHRHRAAHHNASDAPAMLGASSYKTRAQLIEERATGVVRDSTPEQEVIFAAGHRFEALARPLAEKIIGDELYPVVGTADEESNLSASFDGLTLNEDVAFEHKTLNATLREVLAEDGSTPGTELPEMYRVQMEQQLMVSGAARVLFMASKWDGDTLIEERHCWYDSNLDTRRRIENGWAQFDRDVGDYEPSAIEVAAVGGAPDQLPALRVEVEGRVLTTNLDSFRAHAMTVLGAINRDLRTDEDFANAEQTVKWAKGVEDRLAATKANVLAQMQSVDEVCRTIDSVSAETRKVRLELDRLVKAEKESRRREIVAAGVEAVRAHYEGVNATLGEYMIGIPAGTASTIGASIKGLKTLISIQNAVDTAVANAKIEANRVADQVRQGIAVLDGFKENATLFADRVTLAHTKAPDDLRNLCAARVAEHEAKEAARLEVERVRIRTEEQEKAEREANDRRHEAEGAERRARGKCDGNHGMPMCTDPKCWQRDPEDATHPVPAAPFSPEPDADDHDVPPINLLGINAALAPLKIDAKGLALLGFQPVDRKRASVLYAGNSLPSICDAIIRHLQQVRNETRIAA